MPKEMEELTASLAGSFDITHEPNKTAAPHPRYAQYKQKMSGSSQESRRKLLLEKQKNHRFDFLNHVRRLTGNNWDGDEEEGANEEEESMDTEKKLQKPGRHYSNQLMLSEWLVEVPNDFETEWIMVLCPMARRCLIVASRGTTRAFTKSGYCLNSFPSHLPGGSRRNYERESILDCLYSEATQTYYVLDLMCWNGHPVYDSETEFRFFWLHEKLKEFAGLEVKSNINPYKFVGLPSFRCTQEDIAEAVASAQFEIDGLLFFHKRTRYTFGSTPLVVWLKPYMLTEILHISVPDCQMSHKPAGYTNYSDHMKRVESDKVKHAQGKGQNWGRGKGRRHGKKCVEMETSNADDQTESGQLIQESTVESGISVAGTNGRRLDSEETSTAS